MSSGKKISRRRFLATTAAASAVTLAPPFIRTSNAAGKLKVAFWDHWVPGANKTMEAICHEWGAKHKVDISIDFITSQGSKLELTIAAEKLSKSGHDLVQPSAWSPAAYADDFEPVDDIMHAAIKHNGEPYPIVEYLGKPKGHWVAAPAVTGSQVKPPQARISMLKEYAGLDVTKMYAPPGGHSNKKLQDEWTWEKFVEVAEKCHKGGHPFGLGLSQTTDSVDWAGALFHAFGAELVNAKGEVTVNSDNTRHVLEYSQRLVRVLPKDVIAWDDASNNKFLISGQGSLIMNPPSAWAVAKRDNQKVAEGYVDFRLAQGAERPLCAGAAVLLGGLEILAQQVGGKEPARAPAHAPFVRALRRGERRLRYPRLQGSARLQDLGRGVAAEGRGVQLPADVGPDRHGGGSAGADPRRQPDLHARD